MEADSSPPAQRPCHSDPRIPYPDASRFCADAAVSSCRRQGRICRAVAINHHDAGGAAVCIRLCADVPYGLPWLTHGQQRQIKLDRGNREHPGTAGRAHRSDNGIFRYLLSRRCNSPQGTRRNRQRSSYRVIAGTRRSRDRCGRNR